MFKRPRLRLGIGNVNAIAASTVTFLLAACGDSGSSGELPEETAPTKATQSLTLQAIWSTQALPHKVVDLAVSETPEPQVLAVYETGGVQAFNLDGEQLTPIMELGMAKIAPGGGIEAQGTPLTVFPAIDRDNVPTAVALALSVEQAFRLNVDYGIESAVGLCARVADTSDSRFLDVGLVADGDQLTLSGGALTLEGDAVIFAPTPSAPKPATTDGCGLAPNLTSLIGGDPVQLVYPDLTQTFSLWSGDLVQGNGGDPIKLNPGITVQVPEKLTALAGRASVIAGGYPNGVLVGAGEVDGTHRIVFFDPGSLR